MKRISPMVHSFDKRLRRDQTDAEKKFGSAFEIGRARSGRFGANTLSVGLLLIFVVWKGC